MVSERKKKKIRKKEGRKKRKEEGRGRESKGRRGRSEGEAGMEGERSREEGGRGREELKASNRTFCLAFEKEGVPWYMLQHGRRQGPLLSEASLTRRAGKKRFHSF